MNQYIVLFLQFCKFSVLCFGGGYMLIPLLTAEFVEPDFPPAGTPAAMVQSASPGQDPAPAGEILERDHASAGNGSGSPLPEKTVASGSAGHDKVLTASEFGNLVSVAQVTPGPVGLNTATYVGYVEGGFFGSLAASLGLIVPTLLIGCFAAAGINRWKDTFLVKGMLKGTRLAAVALIMYAVTIFFGMSVFTQTIPWDALGAVFKLERPVLPAGFGVSVPGILICGVVIALMLKTKAPATVLLLGSAAAGALLAVWF